MRVCLEVAGATLRLGVQVAEADVGVVRDTRSPVAIKGVGCALHALGLEQGSSKTRPRREGRGVGIEQLWAQGLQQVPVPE